MTVIPNKASLRIMQNADIEYRDVRVGEDARLQGINSFKDVARCLRAMRSDVAWMAVGAQAGAYEAALQEWEEATKDDRAAMAIRLGCARAP